MHPISHFYGLIATLALSVPAFAGEPPAEPILRIEPNEHTAMIKRIDSDSAGRYLVTASADKTAKVWSLFNGRLLNTLRVPIGSGNEGKLYAVALSPDSNVVALGGWARLGFNGNEMNNNIFLFDRTSGRLLHRITGLPEVIHHLAFSPDGRTLAVSLGGNNGIRLFSVNNGQLLAQDLDYGGGSYSVQFSSDGRQLVATSYDGDLRLYRWNSNQLSLQARRSAPGGEQPYSARFSPDGTHIALVFNDTTAVNVLDTNDLSFLYAPDTAGMKGRLGCIAWFAQGLVAGSASKAFDGQWHDYIRLWQGHTYKDVPLANNTLMALLALPGGRLAFGASDPAWGVLDLQGKLVLHHTPMIADVRNNLKGFTLSPNGEQVRFGYELWGKSPAVFDSRNRQLLPSDNRDLQAPLLVAPRIEITDWEDTSSPKLNGVSIQHDEFGLSRSLALLPDEKGFVLGADWGLYLFDNSGSQRWRQPTPGEAWSVNVSQDGRWVVAALGDGTIRWYRTSDGVEQLAFFPHADRKRWIMWTPEGYYDASPGAEDLIGWHLNQGKDKEARFIPSGQLYDVFFRPDIVQAKFKGEDISSMITITAAQALKMPPPILSFTKVPSKTKLNKEKVCYKAVATGGGIGEVRLFQNGKLIKSDGFYRESVAKVNTGIKLASNDSATVTRALKLTKTAQNSEPPMVSNSKGNEYTECQEIETIPGDNEISVAAFNANNTIQSALETTHFTADRKAEAPHLYVLGIGIDQYTASENNLKYAVKDAADFRGMIQDKAKGLFDAKNIHIEGLSNAKATKAGIQQAIASISAKVKPWDSFVLFVASHGYLQDNQYYIVTSDFDGAIDTTKMISSNEIVGMSKNIKSLSQLLIFDTCHAGGVDNIISGLYDARMSVMAKKMGLHIYASAGSTQTALDGYKGNGLFTHALLGSMKANTTDSNRDNEVSVAELGEQAKQETMAISTKLGFPQSPNIINFGKDNALFRVK